MVGRVARASRRPLRIVAAAAADDQTVRTLVHAGVVRAMELDINSARISFNTYARRACARQAAATLAAPATRYSVPDDRGFFAVFRRTHSLG